MTPFRGVLLSTVQKMWKPTVSAIAQANIESLDCCQLDDLKETVRQVCVYTHKAINHLPWFYRLPIKILAAVMGILCLATTARSLESLHPEKRAHFLRRVRIVPFFGMLNKFVRALAFLSLFDNPSMLATVPIESPRQAPQ